MGKDPKSKEKKFKKRSRQDVNPVEATFGADQIHPEADEKSPPDAAQESNQSKGNLDDEFAAFYLRQATSELSDDLDKLRKAGDFSERSLPMLVQALQEGQDTFSREQKARIMRVGLHARNGTA